VPVPGVVVTLHRVASDRAGPLDSARVGSDGRFAFAYRLSGAEDAIYFVSASHSGLAYFAEPLRVDERAATAEITVFDTTSAPIPLTVRGRHVIVGAPAASGRRTVNEIYELSNDTTVTAVAPAGGSTFAAVLPPGATDVQIGGGDVPAEAVVFDSGRVNVEAPFSPGLKQLAYTYTLPPESFPLRVPLLRGAEVLEVLLEEPTAAVSGAGLAPVEPAAVSGRAFRRFLAQRVAPSAVAQITVPAAPRFGRQGYLYALAGAVAGLMLVALLRALAFRRRAAVPAVAPVSASERFAQAIAALDAEFERRPAPPTPIGRATPRAARRSRRSSPPHSPRSRARGSRAAAARVPRS
jgi:hypothetical protein